MAGKTVLVTGGAGFIGSHLCEALLALGENVICLDSLGSGSKDNVKQQLYSQNFTFIEHNIIQPFDTPKKIDQIYHFASRASPVDFEKYPIEIALTNSIGTLNMLKLARKNNARILVASTSEVYGDPKESPQKETYWGNVNPNGPRACYDESKRFSEMISLAFKKEHNMDVRIARIFNTYGPRMRPDDGRVIPNFITQALSGKSITVYGKGIQTRSFCYITDLVSGIYKLMNSRESGPMNIGNPNPVTMLELANMVKKLTKSSSKISYADLPENDPAKRCPDISLAKEKLKWEPKVPLEEGLLKTIEYFNGVKK